MRLLKLKKQTKTKHKWKKKHKFLFFREQSGFPRDQTHGQEGEPDRRCSDWGVWELEAAGEAFRGLGAHSWFPREEGFCHPRVCWFSRTRWAPPPPSTAREGAVCTGGLCTPGDGDRSAPRPAHCIPRRSLERKSN